MFNELLLRIVQQQRELARLMNQQQNDLDRYLIERRDCCTAHSQDMQKMIDALQNLGSCMREGDGAISKSCETTDQMSNIFKDTEKKGVSGAVAGLSKERTTKGQKEGKNRHDGSPQPPKTTPLVRPISLVPSPPTSLTPPPPRHEEPRGLFAGKNTCYINSVMQALAAVDPYPLEQELGDELGPAYSSPKLRIVPMEADPGLFIRVIMGEKSGSALNLFWEFLNLLKHLRTAGKDAINPFALQYTLANLLDNGSRGQNQDYKYSGERQEDAALFLQDLVGRLQRKRGSKKVYNPVYGEVIQRLFRYEVSSVVICESTGAGPVQPDNGYVLQLYPPSSFTTTVDSSLRGTQSEAISVAELLQLYAAHRGGCPNNSEGCTHIKKVHFSRRPDFLMLQFSRHGTIDGKWSSTEPKLAYTVDFEKEDYTLDLSGLVNAEADDQQGCVYKLRTVIYHIGNSFHNGHYVAISRTGSGFDTWYLCDDNNIQKVARENLSGDANGQVYLALYEKLPPEENIVEIQEDDEQKDLDLDEEHEGDHEDKEVEEKEEQPEETWGEEKVVWT